MMTKVTKLSNWGSCDMLDEMELQDGEVLEIEWPDHFFEVATIKIEETRHWAGPMGNGSGSTSADSYVDKRAYITVEHHGVKVMIPIANLRAQRRIQPRCRVGAIVQHPAHVHPVHGPLKFRVCQLRWAVDHWRLSLLQESFPTPKPSIVGLANPLALDVKDCEVKAWYPPEERTSAP